jgi:hypothetical protein
MLAGSALFPPQAPMWTVIGVIAGLVGVAGAQKRPAAANPCSSPSVGSPSVVLEVLASHAWAAGLTVPASASCQDVLALLQAKAPQWYEAATLSSVFQDQSGGQVAVPAWSAVSLARAAAAEVELARQASLGDQLAPACTSGATSGAGCSPREALAADALSGSLRVRDPPGWARVTNDTAKQNLLFPRDHLLRECLWFVASSEVSCRSFPSQTVVQAMSGCTL